MHTDRGRILFSRATTPLQRPRQLNYSVDPRYQPTQLLPNSSERAVASQKNEADGWVSRGHFMLKGSLHGILLVNGVPREGGGIRPPINGTMMLEPDHRSMLEGEDYMIELGKSAKIRLPNGTVILLSAA